MALMLGSLYDALTAANVPADKARTAAEEVAGCENRRAAIATRLAKIDTDIGHLKWSNGVIIAGVAAILIRDLIGV